MISYHIQWGKATLVSVNILDIIGPDIGSMFVTFAALIHQIKSNQVYFS